MEIRNEIKHLLNLEDTWDEDGNEFTKDNVINSLEDLVKRVAIVYGCKVGFMMKHPEVCLENWKGLHNSKTTYETIYNNFEESLKDSFMQDHKEFNNIMNDPNLSVPDKINKALGYKPGRIMGLSFLESHTYLSQMLGLDSEHVIVDRKDWEDTIHYLIRNRVTPNNIKDAKV